MSKKLRRNGGVCSAINCSMRRGTNLLSQVKMFHFPADPVRRAAWSNALMRENWYATGHSLICNYHFVTGKPSTDPQHPDYVPSIFSFSKITPKEQQKKLQRYERSIKRLKPDLIAEASRTDSTNQHPQFKPTTVSSCLLPVMPENVCRDSKIKYNAKRKVCHENINRGKQMHAESKMREKIGEEFLEGDSTDTDDDMIITSRLEGEMLDSDSNSEFMESNPQSSQTKESFLNAISQLPAEQQTAIKSCHSFKTWFL